MYSWEGRGCHRVLVTLRTPNRQWRYRFGKVPLGVKLQTELMTRQRCRRLQSWNNFIMSERELRAVLSRKSCPAVYRYIPSTVRPQICQNMIISKDISMTEREVEGVPCLILWAWLALCLHPCHACQCLTMSTALHSTFSGISFLSVCCFYFKWSAFIRWQSFFFFSSSLEFALTSSAASTYPVVVVVVLVRWHIL